MIETDGQGGVLIVLPLNTPLGKAQVSATYNVLGTHATSTASLDIVASQFGLFTTGSGYGPARARQYGYGEINTLTQPAHVGDIVALWGTGLGSATIDQVQVLLGGHAAPVLYAGAAPGLPGTDQINFLVPDDAAIPDACFVAVQVVVNGLQTNLSSISKASPGNACAPPWDWSPAQIAQIETGGLLDTTWLVISSSVTAQRDGTFARQDTFSAISSMLGANSASGSFADDVFYSCGPTPYRVAAILTDPGGEPDLGPKVTLTGPSSSIAVPFFEPWLYELTASLSATAATPDQVPASAFVPGSWTVTGGGGAVIAPYSAQLSVPPVIQITNLPNLQSIDVTKDLPVQWNAQGYRSTDTVTLNLTLSSANSTQYAVCHAHGTDGLLTVPATMLANTFGPLVSATLQLNVQGAVSADIPTLTGPLLPGSFRYSFTETINANSR